MFVAGWSGDLALSLVRISEKSAGCSKRSVAVLMYAAFRKQLNNDTTCGY